MPADIVRVVNVGDRPVKWRFAGQDYILRPQQPLAIPTGAARLHLGDWTKRDRENDPKRAQERNRLNHRYGMLGAPFYTDDPAMTKAIADHDAAGQKLVEQEDYTPVQFVDGRRRFKHPNLPDVEVYDMDTDARILTVIDDPDGDIGTGVAQARVDEAEASGVQAELKATQAKMDRLVALLAEKDPSLAAEFATSIAHPDRPDMPPLTGAEVEDDDDLPPADPTSTPDAMDVMNDELNISDDKPKPAKKAPARRKKADA